MITRRGFLISVIAASGALGLVAVGATARWRTALGRRLVNWLVTSAEARELGREYVTRHPNVSITTLMAHLTNSLIRNPFSVSDDQLRQHFHAKVTEDYSAGRVIKIDDWAFSVTELSLCGLAWLLSANSRIVPAMGVVSERTVSLSDLVRTLDDGVEGGGDRSLLFKDSVAIYLERAFYARSVEVELDIAMDHRLSYLYKGVEVAPFDALTPSAEESEGTTYRFDLPEAVQLDQIAIAPEPTEAGQRRALGVRLREAPPHRLSKLLIEERA